MLANGGDTAIVPHLLRDGWFDGNLTNAIIGALQPGMTFIDIGANFGTYTLIGAHAVGDEGQVIAIEPSPAIAALLRENVIMNGFAERCHVLPCALGDCEGTATLHEFATRQGSNTLLPQIADIARAEYDETITARTVPLRTLDAIIAECAPDRIDLIKIDVEGFEEQVLEGGRQMLARHRPKLIMEWHNGFFADRPAAARALHALLTEALGYRLHRIEPGARTRAVTFEELLQHGHSDLLAEPAG
jgi:FkbM family methyltransferase